MMLPGTYVSSMLAAGDDRKISEILNSDTPKWDTTSSVLTLLCQMPIFEACVTFAEYVKLGPLKVTNCDAVCYC